MIRLVHLSGSLQGTQCDFEQPALRVGTGADCDLRFDPDSEPGVAPYHASIVERDGRYFVLDAGSLSGTLVNGERFVGNHALDAGDVVSFGKGGPEVRIDSGANGEYDPHHDASRISEVLKAGTRTAEQEEVVLEAARRVAEERMKAGGVTSRMTLAILAEAMHQVSLVAAKASGRKWKRILAATSVVALLFIAVLSAVVWLQQRQIARLLADKYRLDQDIAQVQAEMQQEQDTVRLETLEGTLASLVARAERTLGQLSEADARKAAELAQGGDTLDRDIRRILGRFSANTYAIPPIFKDRLRFYIDDLTHSGTLRTVYARKLRYWPDITREFNALGLPEEMAYMAWTESQLDPAAYNEASGARGMWQMTETTAQSLGLTVNDSVDQREDVALQSRAAARYLARLLAEFGEDSFMLAMAGYNRGENGVRRVLHQIAMEPGGFRKEKRNFWHLYRLKKLPEETREYVPRVLAAAIVGSNPQRYGLAK